METIVAEIIQTIKDSDTVIERDMKLLALFCELFRTALGLAFEQLDRELAKEYKKQGYVVERRDRQLRLKPYQRFSALLMKKVAETATSCVYRKATDIVNRFTLTSVSHQTVKQMVVQAGKLCQEWQEHSLQEERSVEEPPMEEPKDSVVYIEGDGLIIRGQHKKQLEIHRIQVYEGRETEGKRTRLIHAYHMASTIYEKTKERAGWYMHQHYELHNKIVTSNSDSG